MARPQFSKLKYRTRALLNIAAIVLAVLLFYASRGFPYLSWEQDLHYSLRRSLADKAEIIAVIPVPDGCGRWGAEAEEKLYLLRYEDTVGAMSMMREQVGNTVHFGPSRYVLKYDDRDGMAVIPLYGCTDEEVGLNRMTVAVVATNPDIAAVDIFYDSGGYESDFDTYVLSEAEETEDGVFIASFDLKDARADFTDVYDDLLAHNCLGAIGYNENGVEIARTESVWSEKRNENG